jgi:glycosyltransferase involved in cell wall biosynthesis
MSDTTINGVVRDELSSTLERWKRISRDVAKPCLSVVIPAYNEAATIEHIIALVCREPCVQEVIVVDDCSTDDTPKRLGRIAAADSRVHVLHHTRNKGKGAAIQTGIPFAKAPYVVIQDADLEYDPSDYAVLLNPLLNERADVVFGSRFASSMEKRVLYYWHAVGNKVLTTLSNMFTNLNMTDMETGYKVFRREVLQGIQIEESRFGFEPEIVAKVSKKPGVRIYEVPISYHGRTYAEGKKIGWKDGVKALWCILKYNLRRS